MITSEYGKQNIHANETPPRVIPNYPINKNPIMTNEAERFNGWAAMLGFVAAIGAYALQQDKLSPVYFNGSNYSSVTRETQS